MHQAPDPKILDKGVRVVVAELNRIGARTLFSCSGHGDRLAWYVLFEADPALAQQITDLGCFEISLVMCQPGQYRMARSHTKFKNSVLVKQWLENLHEKFGRGGGISAG